MGGNGHLREVLDVIHRHKLADTEHLRQDPRLEQQDPVFGCELWFIFPGVDDTKSVAG